MGVVHFMPLGTRPGAVTTALAHLKHKHGQRNDQLGRIIEAIVLFTPREIKEGAQRQHRATPCVFNNYGGLGSRKRYGNDDNVVGIVLDFISAEIAPMMTKPTVYWCEAFADDYDKSFRSAAEAMALHLSKPESKGKNLWVNLTGGTNVMNAALMQMAFLSGLVSKVYYTFVPESEKDYLQPASDGFKFIEVPLIKTSFDEAHYVLLSVLNVMNGEWIGSDDLLGFLKQERNDYFAAVTQDRLEREFLTQLDGRGLERETLPDGTKTYRVRLTDDGEKLLDQIEDPVFRALTKRGWTERGALDGVRRTHGWELLPLDTDDSKR